VGDEIEAGAHGDLAADGLGLQQVLQPQAVRQGDEAAGGLPGVEFEPRLGGRGGEVARAPSRRSSS